MQAYNTSCLVCDSKRISAVTGYEKHDLVKCSNCDLVFMRRIPTEEELYAYYKVYSHETELFISPLTINSYNKLLDEFEGLRETNNLLDVGCGTGAFLSEARKRGWNVYGTEYSEKALQICRDRGIEMKEGGLDSAAFKDLKFDVITSFEVIEHLNAFHDEMGHVRTLLRKGGLFYCTTPNWNAIQRFRIKENYNIICYPEHLCYFTRNSLAHLARTHGFKKKKMLSTGFSFTRQQAAKGEDVAINDPNSADEKVRQRIDKNPLLGIAKNITNSVLTFTGLGSTIKAYFIR